MELIKYKDTKKYGIIPDGEFNTEIHLTVRQSIDNWAMFGGEEGDYMIVRRAIRDIVAVDGFSNVKELTKKHVVNYCAADANTLVGYYMGLGLSVSDAVFRYKTKRANDIRRASEAAELRVNSNAFTFAIIKYLSEDDGQTFIDATRNFVIDFKTIALTGTNYGNSIDGIMDYVESTGSYVNGGLKNYSIVAPYTLEELITDLKKIIVYGEY